MTVYLDHFMVPSRNKVCFWRQVGEGGAFLFDSLLD